MMGFEYKITQCGHLLEASHLKEMGEQSWELVHIMPMEHNERIMRYYWKRAITIDRLMGGGYGHVSVG